MVTKQKTVTRSNFRRYAALVAVLFAGSAGCGAADGPEWEVDGQAGQGESQAVEFDQLGEAITNGWTTLTLESGWVNYNSSTYAPAVGKVNGVVVLRGAVKTSGSGATTKLFKMPTGFRPPEAANMRVVLNGNVGGLLQYNYIDNYVYINEDGATGLGTAAKALTSLEGAGFDIDKGDTLTANDVWNALYGFRLLDTHQGAYVKLVDGFVRFQGFLYKADPTNQDTYLFTIPSQYRPSNTVFVPASYGLTQGKGMGQLTIYSSGAVYANGDILAANVGVSFEGVAYSKTLTNVVDVPLANGWTNYSARSVKMGKYGDVVRFQGAIANGTTSTLGTLGSGWRPPKTVRLAATANGGVPAKITITSAGVMTVSSVAGLSAVQPMLSLDGVSFAL